MFTYAQVYATDSLNKIITKIIKDAGYPSDKNGYEVYNALEDVRDIYSPTAAGYRHPIMPVYDYFKRRIAWNATPKSELNWNPKIRQEDRDNMPHPYYDIAKAPWPLLVPLARSFPENETKFIEETYLGYHKKSAISKKDTTEIYVPYVQTYGAYRKEYKTKPYYLISYPIGGYVSILIGGGVCGTMSSVGQQANTGMGKPCIKAGQPGHGNIIYFDRDTLGNNYAIIGQSIAPAEYTHSFNYFRDTKLDWAPRSYINHLGLTYAMNIGKESWENSRIAYSIFKSMSETEKDSIGIEMLAKALEKNAGYTEAVFALFKESLKRSDTLFISMYNRIITSINKEAALSNAQDSWSKKTLKEQYLWYRDLITYHTIDYGFRESTLWPISAANGLEKWLKGFFLDGEPSKADNEYNKQNERLWRISELAKGNMDKFTNREAQNVKVTAPQLKDSTDYEKSDLNADNLVDDNNSSKYKGVIGKDIQDGEPYEFIFSFEDTILLHTINLTHYSNKNNMLVSKYKMYWSNDSVNWEGPLTGTHTADKQQNIYLNADTVITSAHKEEVKDSNGIVFDTVEVPADTTIQLNGINMKYLKYIPVASFVNDPFTGMIAQEFTFIYNPKDNSGVQSILASDVSIKSIRLTRQQLVLPISTEQNLKIFNLKGQLIKEVSPILQGKISYYPLSNLNIANQLYLLVLPHKIGIKPIKMILN